MVFTIEVVNGISKFGGWAMDSSGVLSQSACRLAHLPTFVAGEEQKTARHPGRPVEDISPEVSEEGEGVRKSEKG